MSMDFATCSVEQLWRFVAAHLEKRGIGVVLVGGAVVSVHSQDAYRSGDLDFVEGKKTGRGQSFRFAGGSIRLHTKPWLYQG